MLQWVNPLMSKYDNPSLIPGTHMVGGDNDSFLVSSDLCTTARYTEREKTHNFYSVLLTRFFF